MFGEVPRNIRVVIAPKSETVIEVRWDARFPAIHDRQIRRALADNIESLDAVEEISMRRYSALVEIATHVRDLEDVAAAILGLFEDKESLFLTDPAVKVSLVRFTLIPVDRPIIKV